MKDVVTRWINSLRELHARWKHADAALINLCSQLTALRAALNKINEWIELDLADVPQHHQLVIDLEDSVSCCSSPIKFMDDRISTFEWNEDNTLGVGSKIRELFEDNVGKDFQTSIERQTSALTLLLTACNWYSANP